MTDDFQRATVDVGVPGLNGGGVSSGDLAAFALLKAATNESFIVKTASTAIVAPLTNEIALDSLGGPGLMKVAADGTPSIATGADLPAHTHTGVTFSLQFSLSSGDAAVALTTGLKPEAELAIPVACTITDYAMVGTPITGQTSGSATVDLCVDSHTNYPPTSGDKITASAPLAISSNVKNTTNSKTGWITALSATNFIRPNVLTCTNLASLRIVVYCTRDV